MSLALMVGFVVAYPMNWWLVANHLKHGMMTVRRPGDVEAHIVYDSGAPNHGTMGGSAAMGGHDGGAMGHGGGAPSPSIAIMTLVSFGVLAAGMALALLLGQRLNALLRRPSPPGAASQRVIRPGVPGMAQTGGGWTRGEGRTRPGTRGDDDSVGSGRIRRSALSRPRDGCPTRARSAAGGRKPTAETLVVGAEIDVPLGVPRTPDIIAAQ